MQISIVRFSEIDLGNRIDAEYYRKEILDKIDVLESLNTDILKNLVDFIIGPFGSTVTVDQYVDNSEYRYIRNKDINDFVIKDDEPALIPYDVYQALPKFHIEENDLLITVVGTLGKAAIAIKKDITSIFSCKSTLIRVKRINPFYLLTYLNTDTGKLFSMRGKRGAIQEGLNLPDLEEIRVFIPSPKFQSKIEEVVRLSFDNKENSTVFYQQAQDILLAELGLTNWKPAHRLYFVKRYSDTQQAGRMDAEYFQPKYDEIINAIKAYKGGWDTLGNLCKTKRGSLISESFYNTQSGTPYIRGADFSGGELTADKIIFVNSQFLRKNETFVKENEIVFSLIGSVGETALVTNNFNNAYISNNIGKITCTDEISPIVLQALLNSIVGKLYFDKYKTQTAQPKISDKDIHNFVLPLFSQPKQQEIQQKIAESFALRKKSRQLLEAVKRAVEMAIEKDEGQAIAWLDTNTVNVL